MDKSKKFSNKKCSKYFLKQLAPVRVHGCRSQKDFDIQEFYGKKNCCHRPNCFDKKDCCGKQNCFKKY